MKEREMNKKGKKNIKVNSDGIAMVPKYELAVTHTARRSCLTNLYKLRIFTDEQLMSISGHKNKKSFLTYILLSDEALAEEITDKLEEMKQKASNESLF